MGPLIISFLFSHIFGNRDDTVRCGELEASVPLQCYMHNDRVGRKGLLQLTAPPRNKILPSNERLQISVLRPQACPLCLA